MERKANTVAARKLNGFPATHCRCDMNNGTVILFDGMCGFCSACVKFIFDRDKKKRFSFAPLQATAGLDMLRRLNLPPEWAHVSDPNSDTKNP